MNQSARTVRLLGRPVESKRHVCGFFNSRDEKYDAILPFIREGIEQGEYAFHIVDPCWHADHLRRLAQADIDTTSSEQGGLLEVRPWQGAHLRGNRFDQTAMIALLDEVFASGQARGLPLTRLVADIEWALQDLPGTDDLVAYECRVNAVCDRYPTDIAICMYDLSKFGGEIVMDVLRTHPMVVIGGVLHENPFFIPPDEFLRELRHRRPGASA